MKNKNQYKIIFFALLIVISSCKTLNTNLSIREKEIPDTFKDRKEIANIAAINWRQYFADTLLTTLIDTGINNNLDLQIALQRIEFSRSNVRFAKGALFPQVNLGASAGVDKFGLYTMNGAGNNGLEIKDGQIIPEVLPDMYLALQSSWEIDIWGKLRNQRKAAVANYLSTIEGTKFVLTSLISDIAISYYELIALDNQLDIIRQTITKQQEAVDVITMQKEAGRANEFAIEQFSAQLLNAKILEKETLQQIAETENKINFLLARYPQEIPRQKEILYKEIPAQIASGIPSQLLQNRPDIRESELMVQATKFDLKSAKAAFFPNLNITAGIGFQAFNPEFLFTTPASLAYSALGTLVAPLINRSALKAKFYNAKANQLSAMYSYQQAILNAYLEVANQLSILENLKEINALKKQQSSLLTQSFQTSTDLFKSTKATYLEVLFAQQNALQTQLELIDANKRQQIATVNIYKALGGGWR